MPPFRIMNWTSFKAYFVLHLSISALIVSGRLPEGDEIASTENVIPRGFDLNKFPEKDQTLENLCSSQQITSPQLGEKLDDQSSALDMEGIAKTPFSLQQFTTHAFPKPTSQDHGGESLAQEFISHTYSSGDSRKRKSSASIYRTNPKRSKQVDTAIDEASSGSRNQERSVDNYFSPNPGQKHSSSEEGEDSFHEIGEKQHLKISASISNLPHSRAGMLNQKGLQAMRDSKGKVQKKELNSSIRPETSRDDKEIFNSNDWNFLRDPESTTTDDHLEQFLRFLNKCRGHENSNKFFLADKEQIKKFMRKFVVVRTNYFVFPSEKPKKWRNIEIFKTALRISDKRINLQGYPLFSKELIENMSLKLESNSKRSIEQNGRRKLGVRINFVKDVTKVTQLLNVIYLSLFKGNENEVITVKEFENNLEFFKNLWWEIEAGNTELIAEDWALQLHKMLNFKLDNYNGYEILSNKAEMYRISLKFLKHWLKTTEKCPKAHLSQHINPIIMVELINKMIYFSKH